jgi:ABC-2 type transport system permease protein
MMPLAMLGGAMIPQFFMPKWMQTIGIVSPVRWAVMAIEGGVWRQFTPAEVAMPCLILISIGLICFALGTRGLRDA